MALSPEAGFSPISRGAGSMKRRISPCSVNLTALLSGQLHITMADNGIGFDLSGIFPVMQPTLSTPRYGLFSIPERMLSLGRYLELQSAIGEGTIATLVFPLITSEAGQFVSPETVDSRKDEN